LSSQAKLPATSASAASVQQGATPASVPAVTSCHQSSPLDDALYTKDLLRLLAKVNFIYGEVPTCTFVIGNFSIDYFCLCC